MKKLTVAAIIPARNEEQDLPNCLDSAVKQTSALDEIIVVNDGSTDRTQEIVEGYMKKHKQIKLINFDRGHSCAFAGNRGFEHSKSDVIFIMGADSIIVPDFVKFVREDFEKYDIDGILWKIVGSTGNAISKAYNARRRCQNRYNSKKVVPIKDSRIFRRLFWKELGGYDETTFYFEDIVLGKKMGDGPTKAVYDPRIVLYHQDPGVQGFMRQSKWIGKGIASLRTKYPRDFAMHFSMQLFRLLVPPLIVVNLWRKFRRSDGSLRTFRHLLVFELLLNTRAVLVVLEWFKIGTRRLLRRT